MKHDELNDGIFRFVFVWIQAPGYFAFSGETLLDLVAQKAKGRGHKSGFQFGSGNLFCGR